MFASAFLCRCAIYAPLDADTISRAGKRAANALERGWVMREQPDSSSRFSARWRRAAMAGRPHWALGASAGAEWRREQVVRYVREGAGAADGSVADRVGGVLRPPRPPSYERARWPLRR